MQGIGVTDGAGRFETPAEAKKRKARMSKPGRARAKGDPRGCKISPAAEETVTTFLNGEDLTSTLFVEREDKKLSKSQRQSLLKKLATGAAVGLGTAGAIALASHYGKGYLKDYIKDIAGSASREARDRAKAKLDKELKKVAGAERKRVAKDIERDAGNVAAIVGAAQAARPLWALMQSLTADELVQATLMEDK